MGTVGPEGPINWGPIVGDQMSRDHMCLGPNVSQPKIVTLFPLDFAKTSANIGTAAKQWDMLLVEVAVAKPVSFYNNYKIDCKVNLEAYTKLARQSSIICFSGTHL